MSSEEQNLLPENFTLVSTIYPSQCILISKDPDSSIDHCEDDCFVLLKSKTGHVLYHHAVIAANLVQSISSSYDVLNDHINLQKHIQKEIKDEFANRTLILRGMYFDPDGKDGFIYIDYFGPDDDEVTNEDIFRLLADSDDGYFKPLDESDEKIMKIMIVNHVVKDGIAEFHSLFSDSYYEPVYQKMSWKK